MVNEQEENTKVLVSVIVPVFNTKIEYINETLNSISSQTLDKEYMEIIIVDDCSTDRNTIDYLRHIGSKSIYNEIPIKIIRHKENKWLAKARITGAKNAKGKYIVFLDSDDLIKEDYLKKAYLLLESSPRAGWVYPNIRKFGYYTFTRMADRFSPYKLFKENYCANCSMFRKNAWLQVLQRENFVINKIRFFEDWDTLIRLMSKGWYGLPLRDSYFYYRQHINSMIVRSPKLHVLSRYVVWRSNLISLIGLINCKYKYSIDYMKGYRNIINPINPLLYSNYLVSLISKKLMSSDYKQGFLDSELFLYSLIKPKKFIEKFLDPKSSMTLAESLCGFKEKPKLDFKLIFPFDYKKTRKIMFVHPWWVSGGAEIVLLNWIKSSKNIKDIKIIDIVNDSSKLKKQDVLKEEFSKHVDEQYSLDKIAITPLMKIKFCWNLIGKERPNVLFISSNPFFYSLTYLIKQRFPEIKIIDILHSENPYFQGDWFSVSNEYKSCVDYRLIVNSVLKDILISKYNEKDEKIKIFNNSIDLKKFNPSKFNKNRIRKSLNIGIDKFVIGFIGRLEKEKNPLLFLELANQMKELKKYQFIIVGGGKYEKKIKTRMKDLKNIKFFGHISDIRKYLAMCDVLIFPSLYEGYPLIGLESAAMNIPIIATDVVGFREQIKLGKFGFLYQQQDTESDAKIIRDIILKNKNKFAKIGKNGRPFVIKYHDYDKLSKKYKGFIESLL